ncbi:PLC-like phosphodiesterase [Piedraia hortae CBS 480.64]|uniref:PLC-like phosphodiesterase n=1 Tax=Piedraia hortae CBS 480.64 TaxID=1314780 RepID=A0A6A7C5D1_9PEZI|nr:PLC-like phosphodiesterase [Piedraia hortae CBS 480.64]
MKADASLPPLDFVSPLANGQEKIPQCIAHRGYKALYPENTLAAFRGAVEVGAHGLETDVHLTRDNVVVLSHDATLKRCFGKNNKIIEHTWEEVHRLTDGQMPRLLDLLHYLIDVNVWLLLDIKLDNDAKDIMRCLASTIASTGHTFNQRIVLGVWAAKFLPLAQKYLPGFPVMNIAFSTAYARHFLSIPNVGFNVLLPTLIAPGGAKFMRDVRNRKVIAWTVNSDQRMDWCIRKSLDGVITDDPARFLAVCRKYDGSKPPQSLTIRDYIDIYRLWIWITVALIFFRKRFLPVASPQLMEQ